MTADKIISDIEKLERVARLIPDMIQTTGLNIQSDAKRDAPQDQGLLRNSITSESSDGRMSNTIRTKNVSYGAYQEFGTGSLVDIPQGVESFAAMFRGQNKRQVNMRAQPYMMPAFDRHTQRFIDAIKKLLQ